MKYLVLAGILLLVYLLWRYQRSSEEQEKREHASPPKAAPPAAPALPQEMVQCPVCAVHLPRSDALVDTSGRTYCCAEHRRKGSA